jgi:hypothetical protein
MKNKLKKIANKIMTLEDKAMNEHDMTVLADMEDLIKGLSLEDLLEIDSYIQEKLLTK